MVAILISVLTPPFFRTGNAAYANWVNGQFGVGKQFRGEDLIRYYIPGRGLTIELP